MAKRNILFHTFGEMSLVTAFHYGCVSHCLCIAVQSCLNIYALWMLSWTCHDVNVVLNLPWCVNNHGYIFCTVEVMMQVSISHSLSDNITFFSLKFATCDLTLLSLLQDKHGKSHGKNIVHWHFISNTQEEPCSNLESNFWAYKNMS